MKRKNKSTNHGRLLKVPWIWESWKGQKTRVIWMPNTLFFEAVIATLFSISKNFLNSSTTINPTRVPKMPDSRYSRQIFYGYQKKNQKQTTAYTHTKTNAPCPHWTRRTGASDGWERVMTLLQEVNRTPAPWFPHGKLRSWLTPSGMPQEVTVGPGLQAEGNTISSSRSSSFRAHNSPADRTWSKSTQSECGRLRGRRLLSHKNDFRITGQVFWGQSERIGHFARKWTVWQFNDGSSEVRRKWQPDASHRHERQGRRKLAVKRALLSGKVVQRVWACLQNPMPPQGDSRLGHKWVWKNIYLSS